MMTIEDRFRKVHRLAFVLALVAPGCAAAGLGIGGGDDRGDAADAAADGAGGDDALDPGCGDVQGGSARHGFPSDFPELVDSGGSGAGEMIEGFGGDVTRGCAGNRAALQHRPVVLLHGNGVHTLHEEFGMQRLAEMLRELGYVDAELWAPSYLGQHISSAELPTPQRNNIDDVRRFLDAVRTYLGVDRIDVVSHSLGCGMVNGYLRGLQPDGSFQPEDHRFDAIGTVVCLGGASYGTGEGILYEPEFSASGDFVAASLQWNGVEDATPYGAASTAEMTVPATGTLPGGRPYALATAADDGSRRLYYVAIWSNQDIVDSGMPHTGGLQGADLIAGFDLPSSLPGVLTPQLARHIHLVRNQGVFDAFAPFLDR
jgi:pimeloyl-ACP methyl ester carboxylesterase